MTLVEFLRARLDEDEAVARSATVSEGEWFSRHPEQPECHMYGEFGWIVSGPAVETEDSDLGKGQADHIARHDPARVLAEVEAKRRLVKRLDSRHYRPDSVHLVRFVLASLALPYRDHPDYREEWKP